MLILFNSAFPVMVSQYYIFALLLSTCFCFLVCILLLLYSPRAAPFNNLLALFFFLTAYEFFLGYIVVTHKIYLFPHLYRTGLIAVLLYIPISYLYVRGILTGSKLTRRDLLHGIPLLIYLIDYAPFFLRSGAEKMKALLEGGKPFASVMFFREGWFSPPGTYIVLRQVMILAYLVLQVLMLVAVYKKGNPDKKTKKTVRWVAVFLITEATSLFPPLPLLRHHVETYQWFIYLFLFGGVYALVAICLFFFPHILYSFSDDQKGTRPANGRSNHSGDALEAALYLPDTKTDQIEETINQHFNNQRPYLKLHYTIQHLAAELNISAQYISVVINRQKQKNFNDFVNEYRIQHCIDLLQKGEHKTKTLESIAFQCGFNNRNTFTDAFKKSTSKTPSVYIRELGNSN